MRLIAAQVIGVKRCGFSDNERGNSMAGRRKVTLTEASLADRRYMVDSALGSMRIENMEPDPELLEITERFVSGEIDSAAMKAEIHALCKAIV
jgi:Antitoxin VbhA